MTNYSSLQESPILTSCSENTDRRTSASNSDEKSDNDAGKKDRLQHHFSGIKQRRTKGWNTPGSKTLQNIYGVAQKSGEVKYKVQSKGIRLPKLTSNEVPSLESSPRTTAGLALPMHTFQIQMFMDLRNESKELRRKLNDALRENCVIRRLQIRQERALARHESQEAEFPRLMASHIAEVQVLHEAVRRAREAERIAAKRATRCEAELNKSQEVLQHLQGLAKRRDLEERDQLSRKLEQAEKQLKEVKFNNQGLRRNLQLNKNSFQRQLLDEQRHTTEFQTIASSLQAEVLRLTHKLEDKERDLVTLNMYSARLFKSSPRKKEPRQLKECVAGSVTSPSDIVSHTGSQQKVSGKFPPKKKQLDAYFDPIDCSTPRFKENKNVEEEELTTEAKGETAEDPDVVKNTISLRENESQEATSHSSTALNLLGRAESAIETSWFKSRSPRQATLTRSPEASGDSMRDDQQHKELLLAKLRALDEGTDAEQYSPSPTLEDIARPSLIMQNSNKDRFEEMMMKDVPRTFSPPQTSPLTKEVIRETIVRGMPGQSTLESIEEFHIDSFTPHFGHRARQRHLDDGQNENDVNTGSKSYLMELLFGPKFETTKNNEASFKEVIVLPAANERAGLPKTDDVIPTRSIDPRQKKRLKNRLARPTPHYCKGGAGED